MPHFIGISVFSLLLTSVGTAVINYQNKNKHKHTSEEEQETSSIVQQQQPQQDNDSATLVHETQSKLAAHESRAVKWSKVLVICVLVCAAVAVSTLVYVLTSRVETAQFQADAALFANEVLEVVESHTKDIRGVTQTLATALTAYALSSGQQFPFVTLPFWNVKTQQAREQSGVDAFVFVPFVSASNKTAWQDYVVPHQEWITEGLTHDTATVQDIISPTITSFSNTNQQDKNKFLYAPVWQTGPAPSNTSFINRDLLSHPQLKDVLLHVMIHKQPAVSPIMNLQFLHQYQYSLPQNKDNKDEDHHHRQRRHLQEDNDNDNHNDNHNDNEEDEDVDDKDYIERDGHDNEVPHSLIVQPVFDSFQSQEVVGVVLAVFSWQLMFVNHELIPGMYAILRDDCNNNNSNNNIQNNNNNIYTYFIHEKVTTYLGSADLHESKFDELALTKNFELLEDDEEGEDEKKEEQDRRRHLRTPAIRRLPNGNDGPAQHNKERELEQGCQFRISVYPSEALYQTYVTNWPWIYTLIVVAIFVVTTVVFILYDILVQKRHAVVMKRATTANAVVSNLYPSIFQQRILQETAEHDHNHNAGSPTKAELKSFLQERNNLQSVLKLAATKPMAHLFPESTVLYASLSGFSAWSSAREPSQVFTLLEIIYSAFDEVARKRKIFKVETISDSYVAVAGLPEPQSDHAILMAKFAWDCLRVMNDLTKRLDGVLGPDTSSLSMKFGLNSGPVTAGVLRGDKARFQLFGDMVNIAAKMEQTCEPGKIHLSRGTADLIIAAGRTEWIQARKATVKNTKGSGLQTFWLSLANRPLLNCTPARSDLNDSAIVDLILPASSFKTCATDLSDDTIFRLVDCELQNRDEWNEKGEEITAQLLENNTEQIGQEDEDAMLSEMRKKVASRRDDGSPVPNVSPRLSTTSPRVVRREPLPAPCPAARRQKPFTLAGLNNDDVFNDELWV